MPFPSDFNLYRNIASQSDVISAAIESLDVQVSWAGTHVVGVQDPSLFDPLFGAFAEYGGPEVALASFTREIFCFGNVAVFCYQGAAKVWPPTWRADPQYPPVASQGLVLEAKNAPVVAGFGTPLVEPALEAFKAYLRAFSSGINNLSAGATSGGFKAIQSAQLGVLAALGFQPQDDDLPHYAAAAAKKLKTDMKALFEQQMLQPFATYLGVSGQPLLAI